MSPNSTTQPSAEAQAGSSPASLAIAWLFVGVPLIWGVSQTFIKALALFK